MRVGHCQTANKSITQLKIDFKTRNLDLVDAERRSVTQVYLTNVSPGINLSRAVESPEATVLVAQLADKTRASGSREVIGVYV